MVSYFSKMADSSIKKKLLSTLQAILENNSKETRLALEFAKESRDNETKSTAGDKYETGRAMADIEVQKLDMQLAKHKQMLSDIQRIASLPSGSGKAVQGSLIRTDSGWYFLALAMGRLQVEGKEVAVISPFSPLGQAFGGVKPGDEVVFQGRTMRILEVE
jgi:hypothetical protein